MTDITTGFVKGVEAFMTSRLSDLAEGAWNDTGSLLESVADTDMPEIEANFNKLKADVEAMTSIVQGVVNKIEKQTALIKKMIADSETDLNSDDFNIDTAARVAVRIGTALAAADEAYRIIATELAKNADGKVNETIRDGLMELWNPWVQPFTNVGAAATEVLNGFGKLLGIDDLFGDLKKTLTLKRNGVFELVVKTTEVKNKKFGALTLDGIAVEGFLRFSDQEVSDPTEAEKTEFILRGEKYYRPDIAILGLRVHTTIQPGLTEDPLLKKIMPGSKEPTSSTSTAISLDTAQGLYLGDGRKNEQAVLPIRLSLPGFEIREVALSIKRDADRGVPAFEIISTIAAEIEKVVGLLIEGSGLVITLDGDPSSSAVFDLLVSPRWPDRIGLKIDAGPVSGAGYIGRVERIYKNGDVEIKRQEFGGFINLKIMNFGVSTVVILSPDPFSLVMVMGVRFPTAIDLGFGFTLNGIGGILGLERGLSIPALRDAIKDQIVDRLLLPDLPSIDGAPKLIEQVAQIFPPRDGGFVIGPAAEIGWGSQAKFIAIKVAVVLALPDPSITIIGGIRIQAPAKEVALTDLRADLFATINAARLLLFGTLRDSKIGPIKIKGDMGLLIEWEGDGAFELSIGGFHPSYEKLTGKKSGLGKLDRITIDLSPADFLKAVVQGYFAVTAGTVQFGVDGRLAADFKVVKVTVWLGLDVIFMWSPHFAFEALLRLGANVELFGKSVAGVEFNGTFKGMQPFELSGRVKVKFLFWTFDENLGPITWGDPAPALAASVDPLMMAVSGLRAPEAWKALLPEHANQLVTLTDFTPPDGTIVAHPLAGLEITQNAVPLGHRIDRIGTAQVTTNMITLDTPTMTNSSVSAVSEVKGPFAPGHYFAIEGEKLLARGGFEQLQNGIRISGQTTPVAGPAKELTVSYKIYLRGSDGAATLSDWKPMMQFTDAHISSSLIARGAEHQKNPYLTAPAKAPVSLDDAGTSILTDSTTGARILDSLGPLNATQATMILDALSGEVSAVRTEVGTR